MFDHCGWPASRQLPSVIEALQPHLSNVGHMFSMLQDLIEAIIALGPSFSSLQSIKLEYTFTEYELFQLFLDSPVLKDAEVTLRTSVEGFSRASTHVMPKLCRLRLYHDGNPSVLFEHISTPNLAELHTTTVGVRDDLWPPPSVLDFLHRSKCSLKKLSLDYTEPSPAEMCQMLDAVPHLEEFMIAEIGDTIKATYECLSVWAGHSTQLTELKTFTVYAEAEDMCPNLLHSMLKSRSAEFPLRKVVLRFRDEVPNLNTQRSIFGRLIGDTGRLNYALEFRDDLGVFKNWI